MYPYAEVYHLAFSFSLSAIESTSDMKGSLPVVANIGQGKFVVHWQASVVATILQVFAFVLA